MDPIAHLMHRLRWEARLRDAEQRLDGLLKALRISPPERPPAGPLSGPGKAAGTSPAPMTDPIPEAHLEAIWHAIQGVRWRPRRLIRLRIQPPLLSCRHRAGSDSRPR